MTRAQVLRRLQAPRLKLGTVSGVLTTRPRLIEWADRALPHLELITTKSYQVLANPGNREPILAEPEPGCFGNAVGLTNPGMAEGFRELAALRRRRPLTALLAVSLSADCVEDFVVLARRFASVADLLELNFSCPHARAGYGSAIGSSAGTVRDFLRVIRRSTQALLFPKLTPNVQDIGAIARAAVEAGADGIAAINTVGPEVFREPLSGEPILYNPGGHRGGKSGEWIRATALAKVTEIRGAVGPGVPILGMGGVSTGADVRAMRAAGADVVGIGSVFARVERQSQFPDFLRALYTDALAGSQEAARFLLPGRRMEYRAFRVAETRSIRHDLRFLRLDGELPSQAGEFTFLFLPGVGEKPFSVARASPLTYLVRRRGEFTDALFHLREGDRLWVRGTYGAPAPLGRRRRAILVAGGTGLAVVPQLASRLRERGKSVELFYGVGAPEERDALAELADAIGAPSLCVPDAGRPARVLEALEAELAARGPGAAGEACFYNIGPHPFSQRAMELEERLGAEPREIFACLETLTMCGVGLCGGCECGGRLLCKEGTFVSLEYLRSAGLRLTELDGGQPRAGGERSTAAAASASRGASAGGAPAAGGAAPTSAPAAGKASPRTAARPAAASRRR